jgi:hypothetical protein
MFDFIPYVALEDIQKRLATITFSRINAIILKFSELDLGLEP